MFSHRILYVLQLILLISSFNVLNTMQEFRLSNFIEEHGAGSKESYTEFVQARDDIVSGNEIVRGLKRLDALCQKDVATALVLRAQLALEVDEDPMFVLNLLERAKSQGYPPAFYEIGLWHLRWSGTVFRTPHGTDRFQYAPGREAVEFFKDKDPFYKLFPPDIVKKIHEEYVPHRHRQQNPASQTAEQAPFKVVEQFKKLQQLAPPQQEKREDLRLLLISAFDEGFQKGLAVCKEILSSARNDTHKLKEFFATGVVNSLMESTNHQAEAYTVLANFFELCSNLKELKGSVNFSREIRAVGLREGREESRLFREEALRYKLKAALIKGDDTLVVIIRLLEIYGIGLQDVESLVDEAEIEKFFQQLDSFYYDKRTVASDKTVIFKFYEKCANDSGVFASFGICFLLKDAILTKNQWMIGKFLQLIVDGSAQELSRILEVSGLTHLQAKELKHLQEAHKKSLYSIFKKHKYTQAAAEVIKSMLNSQLAKWHTVFEQFKKNPAVYGEALEQLFSGSQKESPGVVFDELRSEIRNELLSRSGDDSLCAWLFYKLFVSSSKEGQSIDGYHRQCLMQACALKNVQAISHALNLLKEHAELIADEEQGLFYLKVIKNALDLDNSQVHTMVYGVLEDVIEHASVGFCYGAAALLAAKNLELALTISSYADKAILHPHKNLGQSSGDASSGSRAQVIKKLKLFEESGAFEAFYNHSAPSARCMYQLAIALSSRYARNVKLDFFMTLHEQMTESINLLHEAKERGYQIEDEQIAGAVLGNFMVSLAESGRQQEAFELGMAHWQRYSFFKNYLVKVIVDKNVQPQIEEIDLVLSFMKDLVADGPEEMEDKNNHFLGILSKKTRMYPEAMSSEATVQRVVCYCFNEIGLEFEGPFAVQNIIKALEDSSKNIGQELTMIGGLLLKLNLIEEARIFLVEAANRSFHRALFALAWADASRAAHDQRHLSDLCITLDKIAKLLNSNDAQFYKKQFNALLGKLIDLIGSSGLKNSYLVTNYALHLFKTFREIDYLYRAVKIIANLPAEQKVAAYDDAMADPEKKAVYVKLFDDLYETVMKDGTYNELLAMAALYVDFFNNKLFLHNDSLLDLIERNIAIKEKALELFKNIKNKSEQDYKQEGRLKIALAELLWQQAALKNLKNDNKLIARVLSYNSHHPGALCAKGVHLLKSGKKNVIKQAKEALQESAELGFEVAVHVMLNKFGDNDFSADKKLKLAFTCAEKNGSAQALEYLVGCLGNNGHFDADKILELALTHKDKLDAQARTKATQFMMSKATEKDPIDQEGLRKGFELMQEVLQKYPKHTAAQAIMGTLLIEGVGCEVDFDRGFDYLVSAIIGMHGTTCELLGGWHEMLGSLERYYNEHQYNEKAFFLLYWNKIELWRSKSPAQIQQEAQDIIARLEPRLSEIQNPKYKLLVYHLLIGAYLACATIDVTNAYEYVKKMMSLLLTSRGLAKKERELLIASDMKLLQLNSLLKEVYGKKPQFDLFLSMVQKEADMVIAAMPRVKVVS